MSTDCVSLVSFTVAVLLYLLAMLSCLSTSSTRLMLMPKMRTVLMDHHLGSTGAKAASPRNGPFTCKVCEIHSSYTPVSFYSTHMCIHGHTCSHSHTPLSCPIVLLPFKGHTHTYSFPRQRIGAMDASSVSVNLASQPLHLQKEGLVSPAQQFVLESDCRDLQVTPIK